MPPAALSLCGALEAAAARNGLPTAFFTRLIWQESRFDPAARSPVGAQGVAQFMPATAAGRGLTDPFEPARALDESAAYLKELRDQFGNLGLAAAGYNAGPGRTARWIAGETFLPQETLDYVRIVTGHGVEEWRAATPPALQPEPGFSCLAFAGDAGRRAAPASPADPNAPTPKPWSVIIVGALSREAVVREYGIVRASHGAVLGALTPTIVHRRIGGEPIMRYVAQIERDDRASSNDLCKRLERSGGVCVVLRKRGPLTPPPFGHAALQQRHSSPAPRRSLCLLAELTSQRILHCSIDPGATSGGPDDQRSFPTRTVPVHRRARAPRRLFGRPPPASSSSPSSSAPPPTVTRVSRPPSRSSHPPPPSRWR